MPILKELAIAAPVLFLLLLLSEACFGPADTQAKSLTGDRAWIAAESVPAERFLFSGSIVTSPSWRGAYPVRTAFRPRKTPASRIRGVFAQFVPGDPSRQG
jgi:hypothetical protein